MSTEPTSGADSGQQSATPTNKKARNPLERLVVWGLIVILLLVCGVEAMARFGYTKSLTSLQTAMEGDTQGDALQLEEVSAHIAGFPSRTEDESTRVVTYHWRGLLKDYGTIKLAYSRENEVLSLQTAEPPPVEEKATYAADESDGEAPPTSGPGGMMGGGVGGGMGMGGPPGGFDPMSFDKDGDEKVSLEEAPDPMKTWFEESDTNGDGFLDADEFQVRMAAIRAAGGGGRGVNPMQFDADGDGKLSKDEAPERMQENFAESDTNSDGFLDEAELEARRAAFRARREGGPTGPAAESGRPQRPTEDAESAPAESADSPPVNAEKPADDAGTEPTEPAAADKPAEDAGTEPTEPAADDKPADE